MKFVDMELARRLEVAGHSEVSAEQQDESGRYWKDRMAVGGGLAVFAGLGSPVTQAEGLGLHGPVSEDEFERLEEFFRSRGSAVIIEVCPMADATFVEALGKRGYRIMEFSNVLVREICPGEDFPTPGPGVEVRRASGGESRIFAETVARGFAEYFAVTDEMIATIEGFHSGSDLHPYIAFVDGAPVAGATLTVRRGVAGLFGASTLPEYRRRGIQAALISARMEAARAAGCDLAMSITLPSSGSQRNLERWGFRVVYTRAKFTRDWN